MHVGHFKGLGVVQVASIQPGLLQLSVHTSQQLPVLGQPHASNPPQSMPCEPESKPLPCVCEPRLGPCLAPKRRPGPRLQPSLKLPEGLGSCRHPPPQAPEGPPQGLESRHGPRESLDFMLCLSPLLAPSLPPFLVLVH